MASHGMRKGPGLGWTGRTFAVLVPLFLLGQPITVLGPTHHAYSDDTSTGPALSAGPSESKSGLPLEGQPTTPSVVQTQDYDFKLTTHEVSTASTYEYVTPGGNYSFSKQTPWAMSYTSLWGNTTSFSAYGVEEGDAFLTPSLSVIGLGSSSYQVNTTEMGGNNVHGYLSCGYSFAGTPEETSCDYQEAAGVSASFSVAWITSGSYLAIPGSTSAYSTSGQEGLVSLSSNSTTVYIGSQPDESTWRISLRLDWGDYGAATLMEGGLTFAGASYQGVVVVFPTDSRLIDPTLVEDSSHYNYYCTFPSSVTSGDVVVAAAMGAYSSAWGSAPGAPTDSLSSSFSLQATASESGYLAMYPFTDGTLFSEIYSARLTSSGSDTVTFSESANWVAALCLEVSGISPSEYAANIGGGTEPTSGGDFTVSSSTITPSSSDFVLAASAFGYCDEGFPELSGYPTSGYTSADQELWDINSGGDDCDYGSADTGAVFSTEYVASYGSGSTTASFSATPSGESYPWVETLAAFPPTVTQPITLDAQEGATTDSASVSCSGGGGTYTTSGGTQDFTCDAGATVTVTLSTGSSNNRWCFSGSCTDSVSFTACSSGCGSYDYYEQFQNTFDATPKLGSGSTYWDYTATDDITVTGTASGYSGASLCYMSTTSGSPSTVDCVGWSDYDQAVTLPELYVSSTERWAPSSSTASFTPTSGGNNFYGNYYRQWQVEFEVSPSGDGTTTPSSTNFYNDTSSLSISASPSSGHGFYNWSASTSSISFAPYTSSSTTATIDAAGTITASFNLNGTAYSGYEVCGNSTCTDTLYGVETTYRQPSVSLPQSTFEGHSQPNCHLISGAHPFNDTCIATFWAGLASCDYTGQHTSCASGDVIQGGTVSFVQYNETTHVTTNSSYDFEQENSSSSPSTRTCNHAISASAGGDAIEVSVANEFILNGTSGGWYTVTVYDPTAGWTCTQSFYDAYNPVYAEYIAERPQNYTQCGSACEANSQYSLPYFTDVDFSNDELYTYTWAGAQTFLNSGDGFGVDMYNTFSTTQYQNTITDIMYPDDSFTVGYNCSLGT